ncbi:MAG: DUF99 family protein [Promethearchaeota archaeon]
MTPETSLLKRAARLLGIAESGLMGASHSVLGGIVIRADLIIDGIIWSKVTVRGMDATETIISMVQRLARDDLNGIMIHGCVLAGYNIIDLSEVYKATNLPVISITGEPHEDLESHLKSTFPSDWKARLKVARRNGEMHSISIDNQNTVYGQFIGCKKQIVKGVLKRFTHFGGIPEPIRVARILARALVKNELYE